MMATRFEEKYDTVVRPAMQEQFSYPNVMEMPRIEKVVINMGVGEAVTDSKKIDAAARERTLFAGLIAIII